jgi:hypothetical protein
MIGLDGPTPGAPFGGMMPREKPAYPLALESGGLSIDHF